MHHDSVQPRYLKKWEVNGKTHLYSDKFRGFSVFFSRRNPKATESFRFARLLSVAMVARGFAPTLHHAEQIPGENRKLVDADLGLYEFGDLVVLKTAAMPAALLACGVIVNRAEEASLQTPEVQQRIVDAAAEAVLQFFSSEAIVAETGSLTGKTAAPPDPKIKIDRCRADNSSLACLSFVLRRVRNQLNNRTNAAGCRAD